MTGGPQSVRRGDVALVRWPFSDGRGAKLRPAVVVQADRLNRRLSNTVLAAVTSNTKRATSPNQLLIVVATPEGRATGLLKDSAVACETLFTISRSLLTRRIGRLPDALIDDLDAYLRSALGLP